MTWTDERVARLATLWARGLSAAQIARELGGVSRNAVLGKLHRLGLLGSRAPASAPGRYQGAADLVRSTAAPAAARAAAGVKAVEAEPPQPPHSFWRIELFAPLASSRPRPWLSRDVGECAFPVGGEGEALISCCAPVRPRSAYCPAHHAVVFRRERPAARAAQHERLAEELQRRAA